MQYGAGPVSIDMFYEYVDRQEKDHGQYWIKRTFNRDRFNKKIDRKIDKWDSWKPSDENLGIDIVEV